MHGSPRCLIALPAVALLVLAPGCTRHQFRERADKDVEGIITQKNVYPDWQVKNWHVYPDPRARFADTSSPDRPPYPPDDPAARALAPNPQRPTKKSGVGRVDGTGYVALLEQWDAENRGSDPVPPARGAAPLPATLPPGNAIRQASATEPAAPTGARPVAQAAPTGTVRPATGAPFYQNNWNRPGGNVPNAVPPTVQRLPAPTVVTGDRPAVRHSPGAVAPSEPVKFAPQPVLPASASEQPKPATEPVAPAVQPQPPAPKPSEFGPWQPAKPRIPGPVVRDRGNGPAITELRPPVVMVAVGEVEQNGKAVPAIAVVPVPPAGAPVAQPIWKASGQPDVKLPPVPAVPGPPVPDPNPLPGPMTQPMTGGPVGLGPAGPVYTAAGDDAAAYLRALESGAVGYRIKLEQAIELGLVNSREFQDRREDLYLAALPVTLQRFNFASQAFFTEQVVRRSVGRELNNGGERWTLNTAGGVSKLFPTGAQLLVQLANQVVIDLSGDRPTTTVGNLTLSLAQPFLQGGGYAVTLEGLTQAERTLVYATRSYARFRSIFYVALAAGGDYTNNPYGLQGLSANLGRGIGNNLTAPRGGFLPLLLQQAIINNQRKNVASLEDLLKKYQAERDGGQQSELQVGQVEVQLLNSRGQLLGSAGNNGTAGGGGGGIRGYLDALDNYKLQLGLPATVALELDDAPLKPIREHLARFEEVFAQVRQVEQAAGKFDPAEPVAAFRKRWLDLLTAAPLTRGTAFAKDVVVRWATWGPDKLTDEQLRARLTALLAERNKVLDARVAREKENKPAPPGEAAQLAQLKADIDLGTFEQRVREYEAQPWARKEGAERRQVQAVAFNATSAAFALVVLDARNERLVAQRSAWPELAAVPVEGANVLGASLDEAYAAVTQTALTSRRDLMNARGQVVDAWRQIAITANSLQGVFDVRYDLNGTTPDGGNNPVAFSGTRSSHQLTFRAELPLVRRAERNNYRAALISYQRQRRTLMAFEDNIATDVRADVRELRTLGELYKIQKRAVELGYAQVDNAQAVLFAPPEPNAGGNAGSAAALTQQVLQAQSGLLQAQNNLYQIWVQYIAARMTFYLNLDQLTLDERGVWRDELLDRTNGGTAPERLPLPQPVGGRP
jgi:hypothetical protein